MLDRDTGKLFQTVETQHEKLQALTFVVDHWMVIVVLLHQRCFETVCLLL